jgi:hypothetical protein
VCVGLVGGQRLAGGREELVVGVELGVDLDADGELPARDNLARGIWSLLPRGLESLPNIL